MTINICIFSGGFDSTLVLSQIFEKINNETPDERLLIISVIPNYSGKKKDREKTARESIIEYLSNTYDRVEYEISTIEIKYSDGIYRPKMNRKLIQPITWLDGLMSSDIFNYNKLDTIKIQMSYIKDDCAMVDRRDIENIIRSSFNIMWVENVKPSIQVLFPLAYYSKYEVIEKLIIDYPELYNNATTCEDGFHDSDNCGICHSCTELKWALIKIATTSILPSARDFANKELQRRFHQLITITSFGDKDDI